MRGSRWACALWAGVMLWGASASARPKINAATDAEAADTVSRVLAVDFAAGDYSGAATKLSRTASQCEDRGCRPETIARVHVARGMAAAALGDNQAARAQFVEARTVHAAAQLPERGRTKAMETQWDAVYGTGAAQAKNVVAASPSAPVVLPEGWSSAAAFQFANEATQAKEEGNYTLCREKDEASLALEEQPRTRLHLSSCEYRSGKLKDALRNAQKALDVGIERKDNALMKVARERVKQLIELMPHVTFEPPTGAMDLEVTFDDRPVPVDSLTKKFSIDPGPHVIKAKGSVNGFPSDFEQTLEVEEAKGYSILIKLTPRDAQVTQSQVQCMIAAKTQQDVQKCLPQNRRAMVVKMGADVGAYTDTTNVNVISPGANASLSSPTAGWAVGGSALIDVVSAASPDIVSYASPPFREKRYGGAVNGSYKPGLYGAQVNAALSSEPDYISRSVGGALVAELNDKLITPRLGFTYTWDTIGRGPFRLCAAESTDDRGKNPCERPFTVLAPDLGVTMVMGPKTLLMLGVSMMIERGDQSKPYRHVAMFDAATASRVQPGQSIRTVDEGRLPFRPNEQLPTQRERYALTTRLIHRLTSNSTLRLEERLYADTWAMLASTTDARYLIDVGRRLRIWPHLRFHAQTGANFYQMAYVASYSPSGNPVLPTYRTSDRELSPMFTGTLGGGARFALGNPDGQVRTALTLSFDAMSSYYLQTLFIRARTALYSTLAFDVEF